MLTFTTRTGDVVAAGPGHPVTVTLDPATGEPAPSVLVRAGLHARIDRKSFYRMVEVACHEPLDASRWFGVWSHGVFFPIIASNELP